jgi:hypothetical protein
MNTRLGCLVFALLAACGPSAPEPESPEPLADVDGDGAGGAADPAASGALATLIGAEEQALAELDANIAEAEDDALVALRHDRAARASFLAHLRRCQADDTACPPSFDEPTLDGATADTIAIKACACRTRACAEWIYDQAEQFDGDDATAAAVTRARECAHDRIHGY